MKNVISITLPSATSPSRAKIPAEQTQQTKAEAYGDLTFAQRARKAISEAGSHTINYYLGRSTSDQRTVEQGAFSQVVLSKCNESREREALKKQFREAALNDEEQRQELLSKYVSTLSYRVGEINTKTLTEEQQQALAIAQKYSANPWLTSFVANTVFATAMHLTGIGSASLLANIVFMAVPRTMLDAVVRDLRSTGNNQLMVCANLIEGATGFSWAFQGDLTTGLMLAGSRYLAEPAVGGAFYAAEKTVQGGVNCAKGAYNLAGKTMQSTLSAASGLYHVAPSALRHSVAVMAQISGELLSCARELFGASSSFSLGSTLSAREDYARYAFSTYSAAKGSSIHVVAGLICGLAFGASSVGAAPVTNGTFSSVPAAGNFTEALANASTPPMQQWPDFVMRLDYIIPFVAKGSTFHGRYCLVDALGNNTCYPIPNFTNFNDFEFCRHAFNESMYRINWNVFSTKENNENFLLPLVNKTFPNEVDPRNSKFMYPIKVERSGISDWVGTVSGNENKILSVTSQVCPYGVMDPDQPQVIPLACQYNAEVKQRYGAPQPGPDAFDATNNVVLNSDLDDGVLRTYTYAPEFPFARVLCAHIKAVPQISDEVFVLNHFTMTIQPNNFEAFCKHAYMFDRFSRNGDTTCGWSYGYENFNHHNRNDVIQINNTQSVYNSSSICKYAESQSPWDTALPANATLTDWARLTKEQQNALRIPSVSELVRNNPRTPFNKTHTPDMIPIMVDGEYITVANNITHVPYQLCPKANISGEFYPLACNQKAFAEKYGIPLPENPWRVYASTDYMLLLEGPNIPGDLDYALNIQGALLCSGLEGKLPSSSIIWPTSTSSIEPSSTASLSTTEVMPTATPTHAPSDKGDGTAVPSAVYGAVGFVTLVFIMAGGVCLQRVRCFKLDKDLEMNGYASLDNSADTDDGNGETAAANITNTAGWYNRTSESSSQDDETLPSSTTTVVIEHHETGQDADAALSSSAISSAMAAREDYKADDNVSDTSDENTALLPKGMGSMNSLQQIARYDGSSENSDGSFEILLKPKS